MWSRERARESAGDEVDGGQGRRPAVEGKQGDGQREGDGDRVGGRGCGESGRGRIGTWRLAKFEVNSK